MSATNREGRSDGNGNGSRRPQEIQAEIQRTRREMDGTLHAIENRLTPGQLYDQGMQYLRNNGGTEFLSNLGEQAKRNPMPVALAGIGLAWLMATAKDGSGTPLETATSVRDSAADVREGARRQVDRARSGFDTMMREQPLALGAVGLAIGVLCAALAPRTAPEERIAGKIDEVANRPSTPPEGAAGGGEPKQDPIKKARDEERERLQAGVKPYAERNAAEPPV